MAVDAVFRRLRGAVGNALVWGVGWFTAALAVFGTLRIAGIISVPWVEVLVTAVKAGIIGGVAGGVFSSVIRLLYHGRRLSEISWVRFGIGGAVVTGMFVPVFLQLMNWLSGDGLVPWQLVLDDVPLTAVFGGVAAGGTLKLAQLADAKLLGGTQDHLDRLEGVDRPTSAGEQDTP
jgi:hypothetical protein